MYADDSVIYYSSKFVQSIETKLNEDLANVYKWFTNNFLMNEHSLVVIRWSAKFMLIGGHQRRKSCSNVSIGINGSDLERTDTFKYLGITINQNMTWSDHIEPAHRPFETCAYQTSFTTSC